MNGKTAVLLIAFLTDGPAVSKILLHLGLDNDPPLLAPARALEESWIRALSSSSAQTNPRSVCRRSRT